LDCKDLVAKYADYEQGLLDEAEAEWITTHLTGCPDCHGYADSMDRLTDVLQSMPPVESPRPLWAGIAEKIEVAPAHRRRQTNQNSRTGRLVRALLSRPAFSMTLVAVLIVFAGAYGYFTHYAADAIVYEERQTQPVGPYMGVHAGMVAQEPLSAKAYWGFAAEAAAGHADKIPLGVPKAGGLGQ
jgi:predicted anti-sigma-YlaC factor YlaD